MSSHFMIWNAQGVANSTTQGTLKNWIDMHRISLVAVIEPQTDPNPSFFDRRLGLQFRGSNLNGKIWFFAHRDFGVDIIDDSDQVLHVRIQSALFSAPIFLSVVYGKCSREGRYDLWDKLREIATSMEGHPWLVGGDFNTFLTEDERQGSSVDRHREMMDLADAIADCQLVDPGFDGSAFTWARAELLERLDRVLLGEFWTSVFPATRVTHLPRISSDHAPLLIRCSLSLQVPRPAFRFQNMWVRHHSFHAEVARVWAADTGFHGMINLQFKLSRVKGFLKGWNKEVFGDVFARLRAAEEAVSVAQAAFDEAPSPHLRSELSRCTAEYVLRTRIEEDFWKQKAAVRWATEGERNTRFFQGWVKQKRVKSRIHVIQDGDRAITEEEDIRSSAAGFFQRLLTSDVGDLHQPDLGLLQRLPDSIDREQLCAVPDEEEVRRAVFGICGDSVSGPDGFTSLFFQSCWDVVRLDVIGAVEDFFAGSYMPRSFTATTIVLLPKKDNPVSWADFRPISLCNVTNKIISKILTSRLAPLLPLVVAPNQSGFVQGRLLSDNVLLAQELVHDIGRKLPFPNLALKLDMAKAYDRVQWPFLLRVLGAMGFPPAWLGLIERCISSCWFSVLVNGAPAGFFRSTRGLRQGDPLSPSLFVLAADYLSRCLDRLIVGDRDMVYRCARSAPSISHLSYADDILIFTQAKRASIVRLVECLSHYSAVSGQLVNNGKSHFFVGEKFADLAPMIQEAGGFARGSLPFTYLGVPIYKGYRRADHLLPIRQRMMDRIHSWSHRHLSFGGRLALIKSTLATIPLHILQVMEPIKDVLHQLEQIMARFFWGTTAARKKKHWISWRQICHPVEEGGLGIRSFDELVTAFSYKLWWRFLSQDSLWARFTARKYCILPFRVYSVRYSVHDSPIWRRLCRIWPVMSSCVRWSVGQGEISFWDDVWCGDRPLRSHCPPGTEPRKVPLRDYLHMHAWDTVRLHDFLHVKYGLPAHVIVDICSVPIDGGGRDVMRWALTSHGEFSVTSAWEHSRHRLPRHPLFAQIWCDCITPTVSVFLWRLLCDRVPVDTKVQSSRVPLVSKCLCCQSSPSVESVEHLFLLSPAAREIWEHFAGWFPSLHSPIHTCTAVALRLGFWWRAFHRAPTAHISFLIPCFVVWFIWTERNSCKHRSIPFRSSHVIFQVTRQLCILVTAGKLTPRHWQGCTPQVDFMPPYAQPPRVLRSTLVSWRPPDGDWVKLNTDGSFSASEDGASPASAGGGGVVRGPDGGILVAFSCPLRASSSFEAELLALLQGLTLAAARSSRVWIEMDSAAVVALLSSGHLGAAGIRHPMARIRALLRQLEFRISHIFREGNRVADFLAGRGAQTPILEVFDAGSAPPRVKALARMDQLGLPNFRFRYRDG